MKSYGGATIPQRALLGVKAGSRSADKGNMAELALVGLQDGQPPPAHCCKLEIGERSQAKPRSERPQSLGSSPRTMMKTVVLCAFLVMAPALCPGAGNSNQSTPAAPAQAGPSAPPGDKRPALEPSAPADPNKLAEPKPSPGVRPAAALPIDSKTYQIGAQDQLFILVVGEKDYTGQYLVRPDGWISMPYIGEVKAASRTPEELGKDIAERLMEYIKKPQVTVELVAAKSKKYYINGEILKPGEFDLIVPTTVMEGLVQAGGFKDFANQKDIRVFRDGGKTILHFNYKEMLQGKNLKQNVLLQPGDIIVVK